MTEAKKHILFLPAWYPHREDPMFGLFVQNHALAIINSAIISVIYTHAVSEVQQSEGNSSKSISSNYQIETSLDKGIAEHIVYFKKSTAPLFGKIINLYRYLGAYKKGWQEVIKNNGKPNLSHIHILTRAGIIAFIIQLFHKIPFVITEHWSRYYPHNNYYNGALRKFATKFIVSRAKAVSTVSNSLKLAMNNVGLLNNNWQIIPNVIDTDLFKISGNHTEPDKIRIFHISCFEDRSKNISGIIKAFKIAIEINPNLELIMIGDGEDHQMAKNLSTKHGLNQSIKFTGVLQGKELIDLIQSCDFKLMFSNYETFAIVIAESLAMGKPVLSTNVGAIPEVLPEEYGIFVEANNTQQLSEAILRMAKEFKNYDSIAMSKYSRGKYNRDIVGSQLMDLYRF